jgi:hypothetical protein
MVWKKGNSPPAAAPAAPAASDRFKNARRVIPFRLSRPSAGGRCSLLFPRWFLIGLASFQDEMHRTNKNPNKIYFLSMAKKRATLRRQDAKKGGSFWFKNQL